MPDAGLERFFRPRVVLPVLAVVLLLGILYAPAGGGDSLSMDMTSYSTGPWGTRGIHDVFAQLGWHVVRRRTPYDARMDTAATYFIIEPPDDPSATEVSALLRAIRHGATMVTSPHPGTPLADSLGIATAGVQAETFDVEAPTREDSASPSMLSLYEAASAASYGTYLVPVPNSDDDTTAAFPDGVRTLVRLRSDSGPPLPGVMDRRIGRGHAVALSDARFLDNFRVRDTAAAVLAVRLVEVAAPDTKTVIFDEYHHGYGQFTGVTGVLRDALTNTAAGRTALQIMIAGLVLLMAIAIRPIVPRARAVIERRSPFEHVGALSRAYEQVRATRLATRRLVRGLRRRHPLGPPSLTDAEYLAVVVERAPAAANDVETVQRALEQPLPAAQWVGIGAAIAHIERTLTL